MNTIEKAKKLAPYFVPLFVFSFKIFFLYAQNVNELSFTEILLPLTTVTAFGYILFAAVLFLSKSAQCAGFFSALTGLFLTNYFLAEKLARKLTPMLRPWHIVPLALLCLAALLFFLNKHARVIVEAANVLLCLGFGMLLMLNIALAVPKEASKWLGAGHKSVYSDISVDSVSNRANVYYLIVDEYASFQQLEAYCNYVNEPLTSFFEQNKFNISYNSFNESIYTDTILTNILQLDYIVTNEDSAAEKLALRNNAPVYQILNKAGYKQRGVGEVSWLGLQGGGQKHAKASAKDGTDFIYMLKSGTILDNKLNLVNHEGESSQLILQSLDELDNLEIVPNSSTFTMFYVCSPHEPFYFNKDGEMNPPSKIMYDGSDDNSIYVGQLQYITNRLTSAIKSILEQDPQSVIVLCSDHGYRYEKNTPIIDCKRIMNGLYYKGEAVEEFEGKSGLNTMRLVLNKLLDLNLPYLELPDE